jgi:hypothetical protein
MTKTLDYKNKNRWKDHKDAENLMDIQQTNGFSVLLYAYEC